jgi:putative intracellular protease/amidase
MNHETLPRALRTILANAAGVALCGVIACGSPPTKTKSVTKPEALGSPNTPPPVKAMRTLGIVLYEGFEPLDIYGPAEMFGNVPLGLNIVWVAENKGPVVSSQGSTSIADYGFVDCPPLDLVMIPGGIGTVPELYNTVMLDWLRARGNDAEILMSVCSGSALLAEAGVLDGRNATSNKVFFQLAVDHGPKVHWVKKARWVDDGNRVTSSGVSAGTDMSLAVIERLWGQDTADTIANLTEYVRNRDPSNDPFAIP